MREREIERERLREREMERGRATNNLHYTILHVTSLLGVFLTFFSLSLSLSFPLTFFHYNRKGAERKAILWEVSS